MAPGDFGAEPFALDTYGDANCGSHTGGAQDRLKYGGQHAYSLAEGATGGAYSLAEGATGGGGRRLSSLARAAKSVSVSVSMSGSVNSAKSVQPGGAARGKGGAAGVAARPRCGGERGGQGLTGAGRGRRKLTGAAAGAAPRDSFFFFGGGVGLPGPPHHQLPAAETLTPGPSANCQASRSRRAPSGPHERAIYSSGVRQRVFINNFNRSLWHIVSGRLEVIPSAPRPTCTTLFSKSTLNPDASSPTPQGGLHGYRKAMQRSLFCLSPGGEARAAWLPPRCPRDLNRIAARGGTSAWCTRSAPAAFRSLFRRTRRRRAAVDGASVGTLGAKRRPFNADLRTVFGFQLCAGV